MTEAPDAPIRVLCQMVHADPALQQRLFAMVDAGEFSMAVCQLAKEAGLAWTEEDVLQAMRIGRRAWSDRKLA
jgi:hypothetical protein